MNSSPNFAEWSREQKDEYAESRMLEMKQKNAKLMQRYAEVEQDRIKAEAHNSAVTKVLPKKEKAAPVYEQTESRSEHAREWDRGKGDRDHWRSPEHHSSSYRNYRTSRYEKSGDRRDHRYSRNENTDQYRSEHVSESVRNKKTKGSFYSKQRDSDYYYKASTSSHLHMSPKRSRGMGNHNSEPQRKSYSSYSDERYKRKEYYQSNSKQKYTNKSHSRSSSFSDTECNDNSNMKSAIIESWNDKTSEDEKQYRVKKWLTCVNKSNNWTENELSGDKNSEKTYSKFDRFERSSSHSSNDDDNFDTNFNAFAKQGKSRETRRYSSQGADFQESKFGNRERTSNKTYSNITKPKTKRSPQYSSAGSLKNENIRKQRKFDRGFKSYDTREKYNKSKPFNPKIRNQHSQSAGYANYDTPEDDTWDNVKKKNYNLDDEGIWESEDSINKRSKSQEKEYEDDGIWGDYVQDYSKIGLPAEIVEDDEGTCSNVIEDSCNAAKKCDFEDVNEKCVSDKDKSSVDCIKQTLHEDIDNSFNAKQTFTHKFKQSVPDHKSSDGWDDVEQSGSDWKLSDDETDVQNAENKGKGLEEKKISESKCLKIKIVAERENLCNKLMEDQDPVKSNNDTVDVIDDSVNAIAEEDINASVQKLSPNETTTTKEISSPTEKTACAANEQNISDDVLLSEKNKNESDGWSTVSEGEIRSDGETDADQCKTKDISEK